MAPRHRRTRPGLWLLGGLTAGLGMLAGSSAAGAQALDVTTTTISVPALDVPAATVPTTVPTSLPAADAIPVTESGVSDVSGLLGSTVDLPSLDPAGGGSGSTSGAGGAGTLADSTTGGGPVAGELPARRTGGQDGASGSGAEGDDVTGSSRRAGSVPGAEPSRDLRTLRRLAVQSAGDFSLPFLLGLLAVAYLFFQRRMSIDDPTLVAAAAEDDELMRFS